VAAEPRPVVELLERPCEQLGDDGERVVAEVVRTTLAAAVAQLASLLGSDRSSWTWGALHRAELAHPAAASLGAVDPAALRAPAIARGGSIDTVGNTAYGAPDFLQTDGTSWRMVLDVGAWDESVAVNFPGQSGNLGDPHQLDLCDAWGADGAVPLLFSRAAVERATRQRIALRPAAEPDGESA
jgi:penicillin amidase